jgi:hypothetical protein
MAAIVSLRIGRWLRCATPTFVIEMVRRGVSIEAEEGQEEVAQVEAISHSTVRRSTP